MRKVSCIILFFFLCIGIKINAQLHDAGGIGAVSVSKGIGKVTELSLEQELRFDKGMTSLNRSSTSVGADFTIVKRLLKAEVDYIFMYRRADYERYELRHRITAGVVLQQRVDRFTFKLRTRGQTTFRDESRGDYKHNPKYVWRNRLMVDYNIRKSPFRPYISAEIFCPINTDHGFFMDAYRLTAGTKYKLSKRASFDFQIRFDQEIQQTNPKNILYGGIGFDYAF